jgi:hypothetical protein
MPTLTAKETLMQGQDCCVAKDKSPIEQQADRLASLVDNLIKSIERVESKLAPMMCLTPENAKEAGGPVSPSQSVFVEFLKSQSFRLERAVMNLDKIYNKLEV